MNSTFYWGIFFLLFTIFGTFATYRVLIHRELYWAYPNLWYRREKGYSGKICNLVGIISIPFVLFGYYLSFVCLLPGIR